MALCGTRRSSTLNHIGTMGIRCNPACIMWIHGVAGITTGPSGAFQRLAMTCGTGGGVEFEKIFYIGAMSLWIFPTADVGIAGMTAGAGGLTESPFQIGAVTLGGACGLSICGDKFSVIGGYGAGRIVGIGAMARMTTGSRVALQVLAVAGGA